NVAQVYPLKEVLLADPTRIVHYISYLAGLSISQWSDFEMVWRKTKRGNKAFLPFRSYIQDKYGCDRDTSLPLFKDDSGGL
ncbi:hypothetical protein PFISCL1PPCAC_16907, partial [Pristionchus fissidentatus]